MKAGVLVVLFMFLFVGTSFGGDVVFQEEWSDGLNGWVSFGSPSPRVVPAYEADATFDNNGDPNYDSGAVSQDVVDLLPGMEISTKVYLNVSSSYGCWNHASVGVTDVLVQNQYKTRAYYLFQMFADGEACWASPADRRRHSYINSSAGLTGADPSKFYNGQDFFYADQYTNGWHTIKAVIKEDYKFDLFIDDEFIGTSRNPIPAEFRFGQHMYVGRRSSGHYSGKAYMDSLLVVENSILENIPPVANAGPDQSLILIDSTVNLDGTQSFDEDGDALTLEWSFITLPEGSFATLDDPASAKPSFVADTQGTYTLELKVSDPAGASSVDTVTVSFENLAPVVDAGLDQAVVQGNYAHLDGTASSDGNNDSLSYCWEVQTAPEGSVATLDAPGTHSPTLVPDLPGEYILSLVVNDGIVDSAPSTVTITAISFQSATLEALMTSLDLINYLEPYDLSKKTVQKPLNNKLSAVMKMVAGGAYTDAWQKVEYDLIPKTDGCSNEGAPDNNDWISNCESQEEALDALNDAANNVAGKVDWSQVLADLLCTSANVADVAVLYVGASAPPIGPIVCGGTGGFDPLTIFPEPKMAPVSRFSLVVGDKVIFGDPNAAQILKDIEEGVSY